MDQVAPNTSDLAFQAGLELSGLGDQEDSDQVAPREWAHEPKADPNLPMMAVSVPKTGADLVEPKLLVPKGSAPVGQEGSVPVGQEDSVPEKQEDLVLADLGVSAPAVRAVRVVPKA